MILSTTRTLVTQLIALLVLCLVCTAVPALFILCSWSNLLLLSHVPSIPTYFGTFTKNITFYCGVLVAYYSVMTRTTLRFGLPFSRWRSGQSSNIIYVKRSIDPRSTLGVLSTTPCALLHHFKRKTVMCLASHSVSSSLLLAATRPK